MFKYPSLMPSITHSLQSPNKPTCTTQTNPTSNRNTNTNRALTPTLTDTTDKPKIKGHFGKPVSVATDTEICRVRIRCP